MTCVEQPVEHGGSWSLSYSFCGKQFKAIFFVRMKGNSFGRGNIKSTHVLDDVLTPTREVMKTNK